VQERKIQTQSKVFFASLEFSSSLLLEYEHSGNQLNKFFQLLDAKQFIIFLATVSPLHWCLAWNDVTSS